MRAKLNSLFQGSYLLWFGVPVFAYQILTTRMIAQVFGDLFTIQLGAVAVSYLGHSAGCLWAHRSRWGLTASHMILSFLNILLGLFWLFSTEVLQSSLFGVSSILILFFFISFFSAQLFPLFYSQESQPNERRFNRLYLAFHFLVLFVLLGMDMYAVGNWGLRNILLILLVADLICATYWWSQERFLRSPQSLPVFSPDQKRFFKKLLYVSVISGGIQGLLYRQIQTVLAPLSVHYSLYLGALLLGWCLASVWFLKVPNSLKFSWQSFLDRLPLLLAAMALWFFAWPAIWSYGLFMMNTWDGNSLGIRCLFVLVLVLPAAFLFGCLLPLAQRENQKVPVGILFAINSAGNALGVVLYSLLLFQFLASEMIWLLLVFVGLTFISRTWMKSWSYNAAVIVIILITGGLLKTFNWNLGSYYYRDFETWLDVSSRVTSVEVYRHSGSQVSLVQIDQGGSMMFMNGHYSVYIPPDNQVAPADVMMGLPSLHYVPQTNQALLIGLGTGFTALGPAEVFNQLDIVDLDPTMVKLTAKLSAKAILEKPNVNFIQADGLTYLRKKSHSYDLIINNVPSPVYFAASKLWTAEAFAAISNALADDGVFFQWLSGEFSPADLKIVFKVMTPYFRKCDLYVLGFQFHGLVCAKGENSLKFSADLATKLAPLFQRSPGDYLKLLEVIRFADLKLPESDAAVPLNTLDHPYLEMQTGLRPPGWQPSENVDQVFQSLGISPGWKLQHSPEERRDKCEGLGHWFGKSMGIEGGACAFLGI